LAGGCAAWLLTLELTNVLHTTCLRGHPQLLKDPGCW
jgi:hypothetical protein